MSIIRQKAVDVHIVLGVHLVYWDIVNIVMALEVNLVMNTYTRSNHNVALYIYRVVFLTGPPLKS